MVHGIKRQSGLLLIGTGIIHNAVGLVFCWSYLVQFASEGFWNTVKDGQWERGTVFWFFMFGFMLIYLGALADWLLKKKGIALPGFVGWSLLLLSGVGVVMMPVSGFWLAFPQAWIILKKE
jgi:hypothetical protein